MHGDGKPQPRRPQAPAATLGTGSLAVHHHGSNEVHTRSRSQSQNFDPWRRTQLRSVAPPPTRSGH